MDIKQKIVLLATACVIALMLLFPPYFYDSGAAVSFSRGYGFIFDPPTLLPWEPEDTRKARIDSSTLCTQYLFIMTIGALCFLVFRDRVHDIQKLV